MRRRRSGQMMGVFLLFMALVASMAFAVAERNIIRVRLSRQNIDATSAESLAESGLAIAIASFQEDHQFGKKGEKFKYEIPLTRDPKAYCKVEFSESPEPGKSFNNHQGDAVAVCGEHRCPKNGLFVTSIGVCNGVTRRMFSVLAAAPYDYAVGATGPIRSRGGMVLGSVPKGFDITKGVDVDKLEEAALLTVASDDGDGAAVDLNGDCTLVGDLKSVGSIKLGSGVKHTKGQALANSQAEDVPDIPLSSYDFAPDLKPLVIGQNIQDEPKSYSGLVSWKPNGTEKLEFRNGLELNGATLRLKGDVVIHGGIKGQGALIVDGKLTITGTNDLKADNQVALLAGGDIEVIGVSKESSQFQGLLYSKGPKGVHIENATVLGTVLAAGKDPQTGKGSSIEIEKATLAHTKQSLGADVDLGWTGQYDPNVGIPLGRDLRGNSLGILKLAPILSTEGQQIDRPRPKDFIAKKAQLASVNFLITQGGVTYFDPSLPDSIKANLVSQNFQPDTAGVISQAYENAINYNLGDINSTVSSVPKPTGQGTESSALGAFKLDLNQFLKTGDRLRIVWKK
jgi:hypothetical protein